jgi:hypothetical protein
MPNDSKSLTYLNLSPHAKRLAKMQAARRGLSLSGYVEALIHQDAERNGLAGLVAANKEVEQ